MKKLYLFLTGLIIVTSVAQAQKIDRSKFISDSLDTYQPGINQLAHTGGRSLYCKRWQGGFNERLRH